MQDGTKREAVSWKLSAALFSGSAMPPTPFAINLNPIESLLDSYWIAIGFLLDFGSVPREILHVSTYSRIPD